MVAGMIGSIFGCFLCIAEITFYFGDIRPYEPVLWLSTFDYLILTIIECTISMC